MSDSGNSKPSFNFKGPRVPSGSVNAPNPKTIGKLIALGIGALIAINLVRASFVSVDANQIGVKIVRGQVQGTLSPGWHFISPIGGKVKTFSTRILQTSMLRTPGEGDRSGDDSIDVASKEGARIAVDLTINYRLRKTAAVQLFSNVRDETDLRERIVRPGVRSITRDVFANYGAKDAITSARGEIQVLIASRLKEKFDKQGLDVDTVDVREIYLPENIQSQVDESIGAEAAAQKASIQRKQKETEAETARLVAEKNAQQKRIEAQGAADARKISSQAEADANRKIAESLTPGLIQLRQVEAVYKNGNQVYFIPQGSSPNVFLTPTQNVGTPAVSSAQAAAAATGDSAAVDAAAPASSTGPSTTVAP
jgi:regulator of protease activity HflC (stomatin/prohibitin superfamily)